MTSFFYIPPLNRISGGMAVIAQIANILNEAGHQVAYVTNGAVAPEFLESPIPVHQLGDARIAPEDRWVVPEGWPNALGPGVAKNAQCVIYVQNWAFLHGLLPDGVEWRNLPVRMIAVSAPVAWFVKRTTGLEAPVIRPAIDTEMFHPGTGCLEAPVRELSIAWMPRKNKNLGNQIRKIYEAALKTQGARLPKWLTIENLPPRGVAGVLRNAAIFLATGFPEGCPLPPLEAMASGCVVAGFSGMGGWDYMRQATPDGFAPRLELPHVPWQANGFFASDGDTWGAAQALEEAGQLLLAGQATPIIEAALQTAAHYSPARQKEEVLRIWQDEKFWSGRQA